MDSFSDQPMVTDMQELNLDTDFEVKLLQLL
jgi:hypothetical protein